MHFQHKIIKRAWIFISIIMIAAMVIFTLAPAFN